MAAHLPPDVHDAGAGSEAKQREGDRCRAEVPAAHHAARHHHEHRVAAAAPVTADRHDPHHRRSPDRARTAHLPQPQAMADDPQRPAYRPTCPVAARAAGRPDLGNPRQALRPNVDIEDGMNDVRRAPRLQCLWSTTRGRLSRAGPLVTFCPADAVPMLRLRDRPLRQSGADGPIHVRDGRRTKPAGPPLKEPDRRRPSRPHPVCAVTLTGRPSSSRTALRKDGAPCDRRSKIVVSKAFPRGPYEMIGQFRFEVGRAHVGRQGDAAEDVEAAHLASRFAPRVDGDARSRRSPWPVVAQRAEPVRRRIQL